MNHDWISAVSAFVTREGLCAPRQGQQNDLHRQELHHVLTLDPAREYVSEQWK